MTTQPDAATPPPIEGAEPLPASYEQARDELTDVVEKLEAGGLDLDESLTLWERGQALATACETFLAGARERVDAALTEQQPGDGSAAESVDDGSDHE